MGLLFNCQSISKSYVGTKRLFTDLEMSIFSGDQIGLVGLNGSGKTSLLKILSGFESPDSGTLSPKRGLTIGYVPQTCEFAPLNPKEILIAALSSEVPQYEREYLAEMQLSRLDFTGNEPSADLLSGGWQKRLRIGVELIRSPDLLLLDEPTNHLDLEGILWLEKFLAKEALTYLLVSHDRYFLQHVTNKIFEINKAYPKGFFVSEGSYRVFLDRKEQFLKGQLQQSQSLATKVRRETQWLRAGTKARTTKAKSRISEAHEIVEAYSDIKARNKQQRSQIDFVATERKTSALLVTKNISKSLGGKSLFRNLDLNLSPGARIALMGPNGSGKTTLLRILAGEITPDRGTIKQADDLKIVYFDQHRTKLPLDISLKEALSPIGDFVTFRGAQIHVNGWCQRFLFSPDLLGMPIGTLSGGERARIAIAHLMLQPVDILLLDEPTNDLDIPTLETLEESLIEFPGAVVLITHDRFMINRLCNSVLALGNPEKTEIFVDYTQWETSMKKATKLAEEHKSLTLTKTDKPTNKSSYKKGKELSSIEGKIAKLEHKVQSLNHLLSEKKIANNPKRLSDICIEIGLAETQIEHLYLHWEHLDNQ